MKYSQLYSALTAAGCKLLRHGGNHDVWIHPDTRDRITIPRHGSHEVSKGVERSVKQFLERIQRTDER